MTKKWKLKKNKKQSIKNISLHPIVEQLLLQRGIKLREEVESFFNPDYSTLSSPFLFKDMERIIKRVQKAIVQNEIVGIFGDHDADGVSSATVLVEGLEKLGLNVDVYIPDKLTEGHGINIKAIDEFVQSGVTLMFSVDCGTSNIDEVEYANKLGVDVIITDHHHAPEVLPDAFAIINPQLPSCDYPFKELSGTAVAFKVVQALFEKIKPGELEQLKWMLDVVCVGTVADCMPLVGENRILVNYGLIVLSKTRRIGYQEMIRVGNIAITLDKVPSAGTVAYQIAPRINAAGRMTHAKHAFELLRETQRDEAQKKAIELENQNLQRRKITDKLTKEVEKIVEKEHKDKSFILIASKDYPVGIVGIIAGQIVQRYQKPTGIFTKLDNESRGSFRSVEGLHIVDVLDKCSQYLEKYGGHGQAAGAIIKNENFVQFCDKANSCVAKLNDKKIVKPNICVDCEINMEDIDMELANQLQKFEPCGEGNEEPVFLLQGVIVNDIRAIGSDSKHLKMKISNNGGSIIYDAIAFGRGYMTDIINAGDKIDVIVHIQKNEWMGNVTIQLNVVDIKI